jgi:D-alanine-D-alanine ligase
MNKKQLLLLFGGRSAEHEVSVISAKNIFKAINKDKYDVFVVGINRQGDWFLCDDKSFLNNEKPLDNLIDEDFVNVYSKNDKFLLHTKEKNIEIDVVFPILHGPFGEDGTIQGLLKTYNVPFVGAGVLGSAVGMDKDVAKKLLRDANVPIVAFETLYKNEKEKISFEKSKKRLGVPMFVKPANLGSSVGISKVSTKEEFENALTLAFEYDHKIIIEKTITGKEVEFSVLGNSDLVVSVAGEIVPTHDFYSYEAKYLDKNGAKMAIPANIDEKIVKEMQKIAQKTYKTLCCEGMGRVDFLLSENNEIYVNEINTIPGFTSISMYPKLLKEVGINYEELIDRLIDLAFEKFKKENNLKDEFI